MTADYQAKYDSPSNDESLETHVSEYTQDMKRIALISACAAAGLVLTKLTIGLLSGSLAVLAEAGHSSVDLIAALVSFFALRIAEQPADEDHHYGHGKAQELAGLTEGGFLLALGAVTCGEAIHRLLGSGTETESSWWFVALFLVIIAVDWSRYHISHQAAKKYNSPALEASATHFMTDLIASAAVVISLLLVSLGWASADSYAALIVVAVMVWSGIRLIRQNARALMDTADREVVDQIKQALTDVPIDRLRVRQSAEAVFVDVVVVADEDISLVNAHVDADAVEERIKQVVTTADVVVHSEPAAGDARQRATAAANSVSGVREVHNVQVISSAHDIIALHVKLPSDMPLTEAHARVDQIEAAIRDRTGVDDIHVHIEPLHDVAAIVHDNREQYEQLLVDEVTRLTGTKPTDLHVHRTPRGYQALINILVSPDLTVEGAHQIASELESNIRIAAPELVDVLVHTEPYE